MSRVTGLLIWLIGLLGSAIPIVIIFVAHVFPDTGPASGITFMDVARVAYPNLLFMVIAVSGIAIAEALMLFFRMVEVGEARATPALWLLSMVLIIVFSSISYARVAGGVFNPAQVSDQQLYMACAGVGIALTAALALRISVVRFEQIAREHVHENAVVATLEEIRESQNSEIEQYDFSQYATETQDRKPETTPVAVPADGPKSETVATAEPKDKPAEIARPLTTDAAAAFAKIVPGPTLEEDEDEPSKTKSAPKKKAAAKVAASAEAAAADGKGEQGGKRAAASSKAQNPRFTRRSSGTRVKKPRSKDAKV